MIFLPQIWYLHAIRFPFISMQTFFLYPHTDLLSLSLRKPFPHYSHANLRPLSLCKPLPLIFMQIFPFPSSHSSLSKYRTFMLLLNSILSHVLYFRLCEREKNIIESIKGLICMRKELKEKKKKRRKEPNGRKKMKMKTG